MTLKLKNYNSPRHLIQKDDYVVNLDVKSAYYCFLIAAKINHVQLAKKCGRWLTMFIDHILELSKYQLKKDATKLLVTASL